MSFSALRNFSRLSAFSGRESPKSFWTYTVILVGIYAMVFTIMVAIKMGEIFGTMDSPNPEFPDFGPMLWVHSALGFLIICLLAASVSRRLHDSDKRAYWGLMPLPFLLVGLVLAPQLFDTFLIEGEQDMGMFFTMFLNNLIYIILLGLLIMLLIQPGTPEENRFGPPNP